MSESVRCASWTAALRGRLVDAAHSACTPREGAGSGACAVASAARTGAHAGLPGGCAVGMPAGGAHLEQEQALRWAPRRCQPGQAQAPAHSRRDAMAARPAPAWALPAGAPGRRRAARSAAGRARAPLRALAAGAPGPPWTARQAVGQGPVPTAAVLPVLGQEQVRSLARAQVQALMPACSMLLQFTVSRDFLSK